MSDDALPPGNYSNIKYWSVSLADNHLQLKAGAIPWKLILLVEILVCPLTFLFLFLACRHFSFPQDRLLFILMCLPMAFAILGCFFLSGNASPRRTRQGRFFDV
ncbi:hypothetical protein Cflav_PD5221 [Pedosphaera parvula Ellin514]|uniref:Uncharacterized protein n=1 Tax=Pedosphaera parvula (strain Ellin514) TaxID=320771 RepID=B9XCB8_PEDPL|nr:hypothetical protein Cflav_PD5221 [Pedosphaera parvula Ellin514]